MQVMRFVYFPMWKVSESNAENKTAPQTQGWAELKINKGGVEHRTTLQKYTKSGLAVEIGIAQHQKTST